MNTEQLLRSGLNELADSVRSAPPTVVDLLDRAPAARPSPGRRRPLVAVAVGGVIAVTAATAVAAGALLPDRVATQLGDVEGQHEAGVSILFDQAERLAVYESSDGTVYELWQAPEKNGGTCRTVTSTRQLASSDQWSTICDPTDGDTPGDASSSPSPLGAFETFVIDDHVAVFGPAPDATSVSVEINGVTQTAPAFDGTYFTVTERPCSLEQRANCLSAIRVTTLDAAGATIDTFGD